MTLIEAAKQALEALERSVSTCFDRRAYEDVMSRPEHFINQAIAALDTAIEAAEKQGPGADGLIRGYINALVANKPDEAVDATKRMVDYVFATPPAQTEPEFECPRCGHCCTQRSWVGLTDEQINQYDYQYRDILYDAEKMLRENNT